MRTTVDFPSGDTRCEAWLYRPDAPPAPPPVVVMAHGLGAVRTMRLDAYAERFTAAGYACLVFDYRCFGGSGGEPRQLLSVRRQLEDWAAALAYARSLDGVDAARVAIWGTSFGGGHVLSVAARDHGVAAAIAQCPFTDGLASTRAVRPLTSLKLTLAAVADLAGARPGRAPRYVPGAAEPGATAFMTAPDALPGMLEIAADAPDFDNRLTARSAFGILAYAPGRKAKSITCPLFVAICDEDSVAPAKPAARQVGRAPRAEVHHYPMGHFDVYRGEGFERVVADTLAFLASHVPVAAPGG